MKRRFSYTIVVLILLLFFAGSKARAQDNFSYGKTAISFNLTRMAVCEINMSIERFISSRKSIEIGGGLVYANEFLAGQVNDWTNAEDIFNEHGYAVHFNYKVFRRQEVISKWKDYLSPGFTFKNVYYNDKPVTATLKPDYIPNDTLYYTETFLRQRDRMIYGVELLWGKVYEASRTFGFEFYLGARIDVTSATRRDHARFATYDKPNEQWRNQSIPDFTESSIYLRPLLQGGIKLRIRF